MSRLVSACAPCLRGLSDKTRIEIINLLLKKEKLSVLEIVKRFHLTQPTITHHLKYLEKAGVLESLKEGRKVYYFVNPKCKKGDCHLFE